MSAPQVFKTEQPVLKLPLESGTAVKMFWFLGQRSRFSGPILPSFHLGQASLSNCTLFHLLACTSCASHQAIRSGRSSGRLSPLAPSLSLSFQPRQHLCVVAAPLLQPPPADLPQCLQCAVTRGKRQEFLLYPVCSQPAGLHTDGDLLFQAWALCHQWTAWKDTAAGWCLYKASRAGVCLVLDGSPAIQEGVHAKRLSCGRKQAEKRRFNSIRFNKTGNVTAAGRPKKTGLRCHRPEQSP